MQVRRQMHLLAAAACFLSECLQVSWSVYQVWCSSSGWSLIARGVALSPWTLYCAGHRATQPWPASWHVFWHFCPFADGAVVSLGEAGKAQSCGEGWLSLWGYDALDLAQL